MTAERIAGIGAFAFVVAGVAIGFTTIGPPHHMRLIELDNGRVSDLQTIARRVRDEGSRSRSETATAPLRARADWPRDPVTGQPYEYRRESATRCRLCATFALASSADAPTYFSAGWRHGAGRTCYRLDATSAEEERPEPISPAATR